MELNISGFLIFFSFVIRLLFSMVIIYHSGFNILDLSIFSPSWFVNTIFRACRLSLFLRPTGYIFSTIATALARGLASWARLSQDSP